VLAGAAKRWKRIGMGNTGLKQIDALRKELGIDTLGQRKRQRRVEEAVTG